MSYIAVLYRGSQPVLSAGGFETEKDARAFLERIIARTGDGSVRIEILQIQRPFSSIFSR